jgi:hypothetical protein
MDGLIYGKPADEREAQAGFPFTFKSKAGSGSRSRRIRSGSRFFDLDPFSLSAKLVF